MSSESHTLGSKGSTQLVLQQCAPQETKLSTGPSIPSHHYFAERSSVCLVILFTLPPEFCLDQALPSSSRPDFLKAPGSVFNWQQPPNISTYSNWHRNIEKKKEETEWWRKIRNHRSGIRAQTHNFQAIIRQLSIVRSQFLDLTRGDRKEVLSAPKPDSFPTVVNSVGPSIAALSNMVATSQCGYWLHGIWLVGLNYILWVKFWRHKVKKDCNIFHE